MESIINSVMGGLGIDATVWEQGAALSSGDVVYKSFSDMISQSDALECRQAPFGDFCGEINPASSRGHWAWRVYDPLVSLPPVSTEPVPCTSLADSVNASYGAGDVVCTSDYVWRCRNADSCLRYAPDSARGYLAWELVEGVPTPTSAAVAETAVTETTGIQDAVEEENKEE